MLTFRQLPCLSSLAVRSLAILALAAGFTLLSLPARADNLQDAQRYLKQNQHAQALEQVDKYLAGKPKDAQGRFLKGLILNEMGKTADAVTIFTRLTEDYPELPEPYNNLAVIYAQQKQYEKAKQALEMAIRTHPSYATAHENLGDIYARLASQAYDKALQLDKGNASAQSKLSMIRDIMSTSSRTGAKSPSKISATEAKAAPVETKPITVAAVAPAPTPAPPAPVAATTPPAAVVVSAVPAKAAEAKAAPTGDASDDIARVIDAWAAAWTKKDVKTYLGFYASDFQIPGGKTRVAWEAERNKRIDKPGAIQVNLANLRVSADGPDRATAKFRQHYQSGKFQSTTNKIMVMIKRDGKWQIQQEKIGT